MLEAYETFSRNIRTILYKFIEFQITFLKKVL